VRFVVTDCNTDAVSQPRIPATLGNQLGHALTAGAIAPGTLYAKHIPDFRFAPNSGSQNRRIKATLRAIRRHPLHSAFRFRRA
jgi:hypothetical protein